MLEVIGRFKNMGPMQVIAKAPLSVAMFITRVGENTFYGP
jgi:hypothetical protein